MQLRRTPQLIEVPIYARKYAILLDLQSPAVMTFDLQIGDQHLTAFAVMPLLARYQLLPKLAQEVILDRALAAIDCTPEETQASLEQFCAQNRFQTPDQGRTWLAQQGVEPNQLESIALRGVKLRKFKQENFSHKLESYFLQRKGALDQVIYSLLRTKDAGMAQEFYLRIEEDLEQFAILAQQYSQGPEAQTSGRIGPQELSSPHPLLARLLSISQPGQLWPPTRIGEWMVIVRLEKFIPAQLDESVRQRLMDELFNQWLQEQMKTVKIVPSEAHSTHAA